MRRPNVAMYTVPKSGNLEEENEDAFMISDDALTIVISDGATEGTDSRRWARHLVERFCQEPPEYSGQHDRVSVFKDWMALTLTSWTLNTSENLRSANVPWYVTRAAERGSFATLLGVRLSAPEASSATDEGEAVVARMKTLAIGDSCVFLLRNHSLHFCTPATRPEDFDSRPELLSTVTALNESSVKTLVTDVVDVMADDVVLLMTDALAHWFLMQCGTGESGQKEGLLLSGSAESSADVSVFNLFNGPNSIISSQEAFADLVARETELKRLRRDDCTVAVVWFDAADRLNDAAE